MANRWGKSRNSDRFYFHGLKISVDVDWQPLNYKTFSPWKKNYDKPRQCIKKRRHHFANKRLYSQSYGFSSKHVQMWELDHKEGSAPKNWCFPIVVLEKTLGSPLDNKDIKPVFFDFLKEINPEYSSKRLMLKLKLQYPDPKSQITGKYPDAGKIEGERSG